MTPLPCRNFPRVYSHNIHNCNRRGDGNAFYIILIKKPLEVMDNNFFMWCVH